MSKLRKKISRGAKKVLGKIGKTMRYLSPSQMLLGDKFDQFDIGGQLLGTATGQFNPAVPEEEPIAPMPDEEELRRAARRRLSRRAQSGGRASTILDEDDEL